MGQAMPQPGDPTSQPCPKPHGTTKSLKTEWAWGTAGWAPASFPQHPPSVPREPQTTWTPCRGRSWAARASPTVTATMGCWSTSSSPAPPTAPPQRTPTAHRTGCCCWGEVRLCHQLPLKPCARQKGSEGILAGGLMASSPPQGSGSPCWSPCSTRNTGKPAPLRATHPWSHVPEEGTLLWVPAWGGGDPRAEMCRVCSAGREEMLEKICPPRKPMESVSTTHRDYRGGGCQFMPLPTTQVQAGDDPSTQLAATLVEPTRVLCPPQTCRPPGSLSHCFYLQPHNYCTEQPCSFWLEQAHRLPVSPPAPCPDGTGGTQLLTGTSLLPSPPGCHQHLQWGQSLSEERSLLHPHHRVPGAAPALHPPKQPAPAPQAIKSRGSEVVPASLPPQGCPQAGRLEWEHDVPGIPIPVGPCSTGVGTPSSLAPSHCCPKTCYGPRLPALGMEGEPSTALSPGTCPLSVPAVGDRWPLSLSPSPQAQVGSSKRRLRHGQSMSSEERTAALTPKQTPPQLPCLPCTTPSPRQPLLQPPCTVPGPPPHTAAGPPGYDALGCYRQLSPAQAELDIAPAPATPHPAWCSGAEQSRGQGTEGFGEVCISNKIVCSDSYIYTWGRGGIYMTQWGYIQGRGGAAALKPALAKGSVPAGALVSLPWGGGDMGTTSAGGARY